ncbi:MAG TPA: hypothetical protein VFD82_03590 [Planctomycetota bacterium]|nr:hypothetical protein [Planctomycetota bacterium]
MDILVALQHSPPSDAKCDGDAGACDAEHHWLVELQVAGRKAGAGKPVVLAMTQVAEIEKELRSAAASKAEKTEAAIVSESTLSIRVPAQTPYRLVQRLIGMAARSGIHRIEFAVASAGTALEQRLAVPLPLPAKAELKPEEPLVVEEIRVLLLMDRANGRLIRRFGNTVLANGVKGDAQLQSLLNDSADGWRRLGRPDVPGVIDAGSGVPWQAIVNVIDAFRAAGVENVQFAAAAAKK